MSEPLDLKSLKVFPLAERKSLTRAAEIRVDPDAAPRPVNDTQARSLDRAAQAVKTASARGASIVLIYGAHLLRNGAVAILERLMARGFVTHIATNGAGSIHDWEYAWLGASTESVRENVANGTFGLWRETSEHTHRALLTGALDGLGYGRSMGRYIHNDGASLPDPRQLAAAIAANPLDPLTSARADLLATMTEQGWKEGPNPIFHPHKDASILAHAYRLRVPATVHPGIGYDIITNHPVFRGSVIGRAGELDFKLFAAALANLDGGAVLSIGSAIMGPQVFEKALACVNNLRIQTGRPIVSGHSIHVVDLQASGGWDWTRGEPPKTNPAYYLRFCKSFARMGGTLDYLECDNLTYMHQLLKRLEA